MYYALFKFSSDICNFYYICVYCSLKMPTNFLTKVSKYLSRYEDGLSPASF